MNIQDLHKPFPAAEIEWRVGSTNADKTKGLALAYLTARHVMERLDAVCGPENWQDRYEFHGPRTVCYLSLRIGDEWVTKADGAGDSDVEAEKGAISDALKRAAVRWGIGRYLYDLGNVWVELEPAGRSVRIKKSEYAKLETTLQRQFGTGLVPSQPAEDAPPQQQPEPASKADHRDIYARLSKANRECADREAFDKFWRARNVISTLEALPKDWRQKMMDERTDKAAELDERAALQSESPFSERGYVPPSFDSVPA